MQQALLCSLFAALVFSGWGFITRTNPRGGLRVMRKTALLKTASTDVLVTTDLNTASTGQITELKRQLFGIGAQTDRLQFSANATVDALMHTLQGTVCNTSGARQSTRRNNTTRGA
jgi:hypothetical protein